MQRINHKPADPTVWKPQQTPDFCILAGKVGIRFENVQFAYQSRPDKKAWCGVQGPHEIECPSEILHQVLLGITLDIRAGKTTAIVGKSGCGKSTMSNSTSQVGPCNKLLNVTGKVFQVLGGSF